MKCTLTKKTAGTKSAGAPPKKATAPPATLNLQDNGDQSYTLFGLDDAGNQIDLSTLYTLTPTPSSDTPLVATVTPTTGMGFTIDAPLPAPAISATANVTVTATPNAAGGTAFPVVIPVVIQAGPVSGVVPVIAGPPTTH